MLKKIQKQFNLSLWNIPVTALCKKFSVDFQGCKSSSIICNQLHCWLQVSNYCLETPISWDMHTNILSSNYGINIKTPIFISSKHTYTAHHHHLIVRFFSWSVLDGLHAFKRILFLLMSSSSITYIAECIYIVIHQKGVKTVFSIFIPTNIIYQILSNILLMLCFYYIAMCALSGFAPVVS